MSEKNQYVKQSIKAYVNDVFRQNTIIKIQTKNNWYNRKNQYKKTHIKNNRKS